MKPETMSPLNVLVVDDEASIRRIARRVLEGAGCVVMEAQNGAEALSLLERNPPIDLLMSDLHMPVLGGGEMARRIRAARPDLKILYVSGFVDELFSERPQLWEGEAFLEKPFTQRGLLEAASQLLFERLNAIAS